VQGAGHRGLGPACRDSGATKEPNLVRHTKVHRLGGEGKGTTTCSRSHCITPERRGAPEGTDWPLATQGKGQSGTAWVRERRNQATLDAYYSLLGLVWLVATQSSK
jgi:hypothetical protein